eukprot:GHVP01002041.1.p1 GENE.GHVP01002041.1~~GHVP01002041.1.p1  ORF type:complete len:395 (+),score=56.31 GHVP01002041.1:3-1187(+)
MPLTLERLIEARYIRQVALPNIGAAGQKKLSKGSVVIFGMGGLGCPCAQYLAGSGIGTMGLVDGDIVEETNIHRQTLHTEEYIGSYKTESAEKSLKRMNSKIEYIKHTVRVNSGNIMEIVKGYDVVVDATDNIQTRYIINSACVFYKIPLVSGAAIGVEGQLSVYNHDGGPCYRCINPEQPPNKRLLSCSEAGVLGPVTGVIGSMQAIEAIKILLGQQTMAGQILLYNAMSFMIKLAPLRRARVNCGTCGPGSTGSPITSENSIVGSCHPESPSAIFDRTNRVTWNEYIIISGQVRNQVLIDVREIDEYETVRVKESINIPLSILLSRIDEIKRLANNNSIYILCRRGVRSRKAVDVLSRYGIVSKDIVGGLVQFEELNIQEIPLEKNTGREFI